MTKRFATCLAAIACLAAAPAIARAQAVLVEGYGGYQGLRGISLGSAANASHEGTALVGGDVLLELGGIGLGAAVDKTVSGSFGQPWAGSLLAGFVIPVAVIRLEVLGELGRRASNFGDIFSSPGQTFVGVRPGVRFRLVPTPLNI